MESINTNTDALIDMIVPTPPTRNAKLVASLQIAEFSTIAADTDIDPNDRDWTPSRRVLRAIEQARSQFANMDNLFADLDAMTVQEISDFLADFLAEETDEAPMILDSPGDSVNNPIILD